MILLINKNSKLYENGFPTLHHNDLMGQVFLLIVSECSRRNSSIQKYNLEDGENRLSNRNKESIYLRVLLQPSPPIIFNSINRFCMLLSSHVHVSE